LREGLDGKNKREGGDGMGKREFGEGGFERAVLSNLTKEAFELFRATDS
jgi:hypothetical protein